MSAFNTTFLVLTHRPTPNEFHRDRQAALAASEPTHGNEKYSQCASPTEEKVKEQESGSQKSKCLLVFDSITRLKHVFLVNLLALQIAIRQPYLWAIAIFAFLYCGW